MTANLREMSETQMVDYGTRMRKERDQARADLAEAIVEAARHKNRADRLERVLNRLISSTRDAVEAARQNVRQS